MMVGGKSQVCTWRSTSSAVVLLPTSTLCGRGTTMVVLVFLFGAATRGVAACAMVCGALVTVGTVIVVVAVDVVAVTVVSVVVVVAHLMDGCGALCA